MRECGFNRLPPNSSRRVGQHALDQGRLRQPGGPPGWRVPAGENGEGHVPRWRPAREKSVEENSNAEDRRARFQGRHERAEAVQRMARPASRLKTEETASSRAGLG